MKNRGKEEKSGLEAVLKWGRGVQRDVSDAVPHKQLVAKAYSKVVQVVGVRLLRSLRGDTMPFHKKWREALFNDEEEVNDVEFEEEGFAPAEQPFERRVLSPQEAFKPVKTVQKPWEKMTWAERGAQGTDRTPEQAAALREEQNKQEIRKLAAMNANQIINQYNEKHGAGTTPASRDAIQAMGVLRDKIRSLESGDK